MLPSYRAPFRLIGLPPRKLSKAQAKNEIRAYFAQHDGQVVYPSDIAEKLNLDYDSVLAAINELEKEGKIAKT